MRQVLHRFVAMHRLSAIGGYMRAFISDDENTRNAHDLICKIKWLERWAGLLLAERVATDGESAIDGFRRFALEDISKNEYSFHADGASRADAERIETAYFDIEMRAAAAALDRVIAVAREDFLSSRASVFKGTL
jgi:hypothetical protein